MPESDCTVKCMLIGDSGVGKTSLVVSYARDDYPPEYKLTALDKYALDIIVENRRVNVQIYDAGGSDAVRSLRQLSYPDVHTVILCFSVVQPETLESLGKYWLQELANNIRLNPAAQKTATGRGFLPVHSDCDAESVSTFPRSQSPINGSVGNPKLSIPHRQFTSGHSPSRGSKRRLMTPLPALSKPGPAFILVGCACDLRNDIRRLIDLSNRQEKPVDEHRAESLARELGAEAYVECSAVTQKQLKKVFDLAIWYGLQVRKAGGPDPITFSISSDTSLHPVPPEVAIDGPVLNHQENNDVQRTKNGCQLL